MILGCVFLWFASFGRAQSLEPRWNHAFPQEIAWYARTSPGILIVKSGNTVSAFDGVDGRQLWTLSDIEFGGAAATKLAPEFQRGKNLQEVPGIGVLLLNRVKLPGETNGRLLALNLETGKQLWEEPELDDLLAVLPVPGSRDAILVSRRLQRAVLAGELAVTGATAGATRGAVILPPAYPARFEFQRMDALTGKVQWTAEYPHTLTTGETPQMLGEDLFICSGDKVIGRVDGRDGKVIWDSYPKTAVRLGLPPLLETTKDRLISASKKLQGLDAGNGNVIWETPELGKISGMFVHEGLVVALGEKGVVAVIAQTGEEQWRVKTHGHSTNLVWEESSDTIVYADGRGLHRLERSTGKSLLDASFGESYHPYQVRLASPETAVLIGTEEVRAYDLETGKRVLEEGKLSSYFYGYAFLDHWPIFEDTGDYYLSTLLPRPREPLEWSSARDETLLSNPFFGRLQELPGSDSGQQDAYETEGKAGSLKVWWVEGETNRPVVFHISGENHDVSRPLGMVFAVEGKQLWGAAIKLNSGNPKTQTGPGSRD